MALQTKQSALTLARVAKQLADRFERLGLDEEGQMDASDKQLMDRVRKQAEQVLLGK